MYDKSILDAAWGRFITLSACKAAEAGCTSVKMTPQQTSQVCSGCGVLVPKDLSERWHSCSSCGAELDRDENAACNLQHRYVEQGPLLTSIVGRFPPHNARLPLRRQPSAVAHPRL
ncbi:zinc ribbon domain-containing protein [Ktedonospora formicarum]|uniref:zinc ribbon domain-containing protein n=1 Tax=Ktedonospora formicarum TaxID=2778364 RepID=UPI0027DE5F43|nr:zinc ribbon domain-containing protein [Ktedonospora formicarum]